MRVTGTVAETAARCKESPCTRAVLVPVWVIRAKMPPGARLILMWLHSLSPSEFDRLTVATIRRQFGGGSTDIGLEWLEEHGFLTVERFGTGRRSIITLDHDAYWGLVR